MVFLHGTPGSRLFSPDPSLQSAPDVRLITFDRPGYGRSTPAAVPSLTAVAELVALIADDRGLQRFPVVGSSGGCPYALACGAVLSDRVSRVGVVSSGGPIDELEDAAASLTSEEREALSAVRADPAAATELVWPHGQWFADNPLRFLENKPDAADEEILNDPVVRSNLTESNLEGARQDQAGLISDWVADALPWGFRLGDIGVPVDLWVGALDPGRAPLDAQAIGERIPSCTIHSDANAGHWLVIPRWLDILQRSLS